MNRKKIHAMAAKISQERPGTPHYLSGYSRARKIIERKFTEEEHRKYKAMAKEWSEKKLPPRMQQQYVHGNDSSKLGLADLSKLA